MLFYWLEPKLIKECILKEHLGDYNKRPKSDDISGVQEKVRKTDSNKIDKVKIISKLNVKCVKCQ